jgi:hypothetical protein
MKRPSRQAPALVAQARATRRQHRQGTSGSRPERQTPRTIAPRADGRADELDIPVFTCWEDVWGLTRRLS